MLSRSIRPMRLLRATEPPFGHLHFVYELKIDEFRALAHIHDGRCELVSRNGRVLRNWSMLERAILQTVQARDAVLDGEICLLDADGRSNFANLLLHREEPYFYAFDLLEEDGEDLCGQQLLQRKTRLRRIMRAAMIAPGDSRVRYLEHLPPRRGAALFQEVCRRDLEGIVAKWAWGTYQTDGRTTSWLKIKNPHYSQMEERHELWASRRSTGARPRSTAAPLQLRLV